MEKLIETIQAATASDARDETRAAGAQACRTLLAVLEAKEGEPLVTPQPIAAAQTIASQPTATAGHGAAQVIVSALRGMHPDQLFDLVIARLSAALPAETVLPPVRPLQFRILPVPVLGGKS